MKTDIGLGILSWRSYETLVSVLESLRDFSGSFDERLIYFNEIDDEARRIASDFGFACSGSVENTGIYGGFRGLAESMSSRYLLLIENDMRLAVSLDESRSQILHSYDLLVSGRVCVVHLHHLRLGVSDKLYLRNFHRYYPPSGSSILRRFHSGIRHILRPHKAKFNIGAAPYALDNPDEIFAEITRDEFGFYLMPTLIRGWSNHPFMIERDFFIDTILARVESAPTTQRINGFKNIEYEIDREWWQSHPWTIGVSNPGIFEHARIGYRGY